MRPDRSNCETWFIDWIEGNLNSQQIEDLKDFLRQNPDLKEEFEAIAAVNLKPDTKEYTGKNSLKKSSENYSPEQFEYLCIAYLENDLSPDQRIELDEITGSDIQKKRIFDQIQRLRLAPRSYIFAGKKIVKKITTGQKIIRLSVIGLAAAATVAILILAYLFIPPNLKEGTLQIAAAQVHDTIRIGTGVTFRTGDQPYVIREIKIFPANAEHISEVHRQDSINGTAEVNSNIRSDSISLLGSVKHIGILAVPFIAEFKLFSDPSVGVIQPFNPFNIPSEFEEDRSNVDRFFARIFHEKIMKDKKSVNRPVTSFEIAEAGIKGLNKLFGWEIALHKISDANGGTKSYSFTSRLVKFNAPVKKTGYPM